MKTKIYLFSLLFAACQSNEVDLSRDVHSNNIIDVELPQGDVYPLSKEYQINKLRLSTRNATAFEEDWENHQSVTLADGHTVSLPWNSITDGNIPVSIAFDIKKEDGWEMIFHSFRNSEGAQENRNYMIFHNLRTGVLKVFYYLQNSNFSNNTGTWNIDFTPSRYWLNHTGEVSVPTSLGKVNYWASTNLVSLENKGFLMGWNCFQVQLAYDPEDYTNQLFAINSNILNTTNVDLFGEEQSYSNGAILSYGSSNPLSGLSQNITNFVGKEAEKWINDKLDNKESKANDPNTRSIIGIVGGALIKAGVNKIFNHFTASASKTTTTTSDLQFTTKGTSKVTGTLTFNGTSPILGLRIPFNKDQVGELGNWNITSTPIIYMNPLADLYYEDTVSPNYDKKHIYQYRGVNTIEYNLIINPKLENHIIKKWVDCDVVHYNNIQKTPNNPFPNFDYGTLGRTSTMLSNWNAPCIFDYEDKEQSKIYSDKLQPKITAYDFYYGVISPILLPKAHTNEDLHFDARYIFLRMTLNMITEFEGKRDTTISTHTYIPKIEWDQYLYNLYEGGIYDYIATQGTY